jgi:tRNA-Thr(GGU) m(6)t(6)A37 methyltransferase TsaA
MHTFNFQPIGIVHSPYREKFAIPRQPGQVDVISRVELLPPYNRAEAVRGLEAFSHIWLSFVFHGVRQQEWKPTVRPPRLGGNQRVGVFASRSTHRPNPIGLSAVELLEIQCNDGGVQLLVRGADLLDGTPILDIKPYLTYADSIPDARSGYAPEAPEGRLRVDFSTQALDFVTENDDSYPELRPLLEQLLALDPRPAYHQDEAGRIYGLALYDLNIRFRVGQGVAEVLTIEEQPGG